MKITRLYVDAQGETHFEDEEVPYAQSTEIGRLSAPIPVKSLIFREVQPTYDLDWHNAPQKQYIVNLDASVEITVSSGETRVLGPGEVFRVEDTTGKGHLSKAVNNQLRNCLFITLE